MKKILILIITISCLSCSNKKERKTNYIKHEISFLNWTINIPENYISISFEDYVKVIQETYSDSTFVSLKVKEIENMKMKFPDYTMLCDKNNTENTVIIVSMLNPRVNKFIKDELANLIIKGLRKKGEKENYIYRNIENKLINDWLIKVKGKMKYENSENPTYLTQYMASNFGVFVTNNEMKFDFEKELTK